jgi:hypothetical protein
MGRIVDSKSFLQEKTGEKNGAKPHLFAEQMCCYFADIIFK